MTHLKNYSLVLLLLFLSFFVAAESFGEITDTSGNAIDPSDTTDFGGLVYELPSKKVEVDYDGKKVDYSGLSGSVTFSEFGKVVEGDVTVDKKGEYVFGNVKLDLAKGSKVTLKDGELHVENPGTNLEKKDISFVQEKLAFDDSSVTYSGEGVDFHGLEEVSLDKNGFFISDPKDLELSGLTVTGKGRVYILENAGDRNLDIDGAYVSTGQGKFTIGSNAKDSYVAVKVNKENSYGFKHDKDTDYIAFKSVSNGDPSYVSTISRDKQNLVPKIDVVGHFAMNNNGHGSYTLENKIYNTFAASVIPEFKAPQGSTVSPVEIAFNEISSTGELTALSNYNGFLLHGNDGRVGYGSDPSYVLSNRYGGSGGRGGGGSELRHGVSNLVAYNYYQGGEETIEKIFNIPISGNRVDALTQQKGKEFMDILFQTPNAYRKYIRSVKLVNSLGGNVLGQAWTTGDVEFAVGSGGFEQRTISHEFAHIFDFSIGRGRSAIFNNHQTNPSYSEFSKYWAMANGDGQRVIRGAYTSQYDERVSTFIEMQYRSLDNYWKPLYTGNKGVQQRVAATVLGEGITFYNGKRILEAIGAGPINSMDDVRKVITGGQA